MTLPIELRRNVSREEINELPIRRYEGEVRVVSAERDLAPALADILQEPVVGFDTETRPAFRPGESYLPSLAQVATARAVYLFQVQHREVAAAVAQMLAAEHIVKAGVGLADDLKAMKKLIEFADQSIVDLGTVATKHGLKQTGVRNLTGLFLGFRIPKGTKTSNWARSQLTPQQIAYAATDAWACRELYMRFRTLGLT
ncbi:MAG TPA: 3'-5' exonuclease [Burkholderiales bacterium]|nr:3'-5' exonuclease [Burkholderiales bacterium]